MPTRLVSIVIDAADPPALARFWADLLRWSVTYADADEVDVAAPAEDGCALELVFVPVPEAKTVKNRVHLDLSSTSPADQDATVTRALSLGATRVDIGQGEPGWTVLADPEGNEFCVLDPRPEYADAGALAAVLLDSPAPAGLADFWAAATGYTLIRETASVVSLRSPDNRGPWLEILRDHTPRTVKNRVHLDVAPYPDDDQSAEVDRLVDLGARRADVGQGEQSWVVLTDPEGNEFCVLSAR